LGAVSVSGSLLGDVLDGEKGAFVEDNRVGLDSLAGERGKEAGGSDSPVSSLETVSTRMGD
jgi:hypothetical protein